MRTGIMYSLFTIIFSAPSTRKALKKKCGINGLYEKLAQHCSGSRVGSSAELLKDLI